MAKIDLNIVDRGVQGSDWIAADIGLTADHLDVVMEQKTDNSGALNSLPTPFARFFVAREAFRRAKEENIDKKKEAGYAYKQLVSDILDVYELLFNLKFHRNNSWKNGEKIELREWDSVENLKHLKQKMPILFNSISNYYQTDIVEKKLYFMVYTEEGKQYLLACSSPLTGFVTPPDMDKSVVKKNGTSNIVFAGEQYQNLHIRRESGGEYFREIKMFEDRSQAFKNYMYNELFGSGNINDRFKELKEYIRSFKNDPDIRTDYKLKLAHVKTDQNDDLVVNGLPLMSSDERDINSYFTQAIIRLPYRISKDYFKSVVYQNDSEDRKFDYLLPFKPEVVSLFGGKNINSDIHLNRNSVTVYLRYNGKTYEKEYAVEPFRLGMGRIVDMEMAKINFDFGLFPNILSPNDKENNYFKIFVAAADEDSLAPNFNIDQISLSFFKNDNDGCSQIRELDPDVSGANYCVRPAVVRSRQKTDETESGTKFYELYNSSFDVIEVKVLNDTGLVIPLWDRSQVTNDTFTYAVDLGTSNTFLSRCKNAPDGTPDLTNKPELFRMERPMVSYLHETPEDKQISETRRIENSIFEKAKKRIKTEFIPAVIDGVDYKFPIRTALCGVRSNSNVPRLFDNHNIAFFYEKIMSNDDQSIHTDIKWEGNEAMLRLFIQELLLIIKCDILQRNGDLGRTHLVWFRPLSFMGTIRSTYKDLWDSESGRILGIQPGQINFFSESEAPYYYFKKNDNIKDSDAVAVIDIGGGSTDFVYFKDNEPQMANSVHFGCDVLWENGFNAYGNVKENGIYVKYADTLRFRRQDLSDLNECFQHIDNAKTKDIINFWLSNADYCDIRKNLSQDFKPVFVYHLTSILFYMAYMYKDNNFKAPRTVVFSGNGSKYIDGFICSEGRVLKHVIDLVFTRVFGGEHDVHLELPVERKESTCYGGLYRDPNAPDVPEKVYQGDLSANYEKVCDINNNFETLKRALLAKYSEFNALYKDVLDLLKKEQIIDNTADTTKYVKAAENDMGTPLNTYYKTQVKEKYGDEVTLYDSVFFLPIINRIFEMTKI
jgi:hypothetical protein